VDSQSDFIDKLKMKNQQYQEVFCANEEAAKIQLVLPMIKFLGWDYLHPLEVAYEVNTETKDRPDIALKKEDEYLLIIETKKISNNLGKSENIKKLYGYIAELNCPAGILTDGIHWVCIGRRKKEDKWNSTIIWSINIENDDISTIFSYLNTISKSEIENLESNIRLKTKENDFNYWQEKYLDTLRKKGHKVAHKLIADIRADLKKENYKPKDYNYFLDNIGKDEILLSGHPVSTPKIADETHVESSKRLRKATNRPNKLFIGNDKFIVSTWKQILLTSMDWLINAKKLTTTNIPENAKSFISIDGKQKNGNSYHTSARLSNNLYINTCVSGADIQKRILITFREFGYNENFVKWE